MPKQGSKRRISRLFVDQALGGSRLRIAERDAHYLSHVLRLKRGDRLVVFNGRGEERQARIAEALRKQSVLELGEGIAALPEPSLELTLIQALVKSEAMDSIVQKAVELGVRRLVAVKTDFSVVKLDEDRAGRRLEHWRRISHGACEQSGRHRPPEIAVFASLRQCLESLPPNGLRIALQPQSTKRLRELARPNSGVTVLIGPEGGLSAADLEAADAAGFERIGLGPRTLRADTAAIAVCSAVQMLWGDGA